MSILKDINGKVSSKRIAGLLLVISGVAMAFWKYDIQYVYFIVGTGAGLLGWTLTEKIKTKLLTKNNNKNDE